VFFQVFRSFFPEIVKPDREFRVHPVIDLARDQDAAGVGHGFEARGEVDALAQQAIAVDNNVAKMDPDPKAHA